MPTAAVEKLIREARRLSPVEQLHLVRVLFDDLRTHLSPRIVSLEGRWSDLSFDEEGIDAPEMMCRGEANHGIH